MDNPYCSCKPTRVRSRCRPSCPAPGWVTGVDRLSGRPNGNKLLTGEGGAGTPTTWTILQNDGPNHLGLWCNVLPAHPMALITSGCAPFQGRTSRSARAGRAASPFRMRGTGPTPPSWVSPRACPAQPRAAQLLVGPGSLVFEFSALPCIPTPWTILQNDGPNHLGLWCNVLSAVRVQRLALHTHTSCSSPVRPTWRHPANTLSAERVPPSALSARCSNEHGRHRHARPPCRGGMRRRSQPPDPGAGSRRARGGRLV